MKRNITVAFDIDHTLWKVIEDHCDVSTQHPRGWRMRQVPDYGLIAVLHWFFNNGDKIYVWSAGGIDYAKTICEKLGIDNMVEILPKGKKGIGWPNRPHIDICFDDEDVELARVNVQIKRDPLNDKME